MKLIILENYKKTGNFTSYGVPLQTMFNADVALSYENGIYKVVKNRFGECGQIFRTKREVEEFFFVDGL